MHVEQLVEWEFAVEAAVYKAPHYTVISNLLSLVPSQIKTFSSMPT
jgi:hypothetical protein